MKDSKVRWVIALMCLQLTTAASAQEVAAPADTLASESMSVFDFLGLMLVEDEQMIDPLMLDMFEDETYDDPNAQPVIAAPQPEETEQ